MRRRARLAAKETTHNSRVCHTLSMLKTIWFRITPEKLKRSDSGARGKNIAVVDSERKSGKNEGRLGKSLALFPSLPSFFPALSLAVFFARAPLPERLDKAIIPIVLRFRLPQFWGYCVKVFLIIIFHKRLHLCTLLAKT